MGDLLLPLCFLEIRLIFPDNVLLSLRQEIDHQASPEERTPS